MKRKFKRIWLVLWLNLAAIIALYIALAFYYSEGFPCCCWINGVYCTGKSVETVNKELLAKHGYEGVNVIDAGGAELYISAGSVDFNADYTESLNSFIESRNSFLWGYNLFQNLIVKVEPRVSLNEDKLLGFVNDWEIFSDIGSNDVYIAKGDNGYILINGITDVPNKEKIVNTVYHCMLHLEDTADLGATEGCYTEVEATEQQRATIDLFDKVKELQACGMTYDIGGEQISFGPAVASDWFVTADEVDEYLNQETSSTDPASGLFIIDSAVRTFPSEEEMYTLNGFVCDANGSPIISEKKIYDTLNNIARSHSTKSLIERYRQTHEGSILVKKGSKGDGSLYDVNGEFNYLVDKYVSGDISAEESRPLSYYDSVVSYDAASELGDTYIEVNMSEQLLSYYVNGELNMQMPVVTGNINRGRGTPAGLFNVYNKRYHTYLRGTDYVSYVNYWLGVNKGVGIHDATWRTQEEFGGDTFKRNGSHGCINCPLESVEQLWNVAEVGTPVILYY